MFKCFNVSLLITLAVVLCNSHLQTEENFTGLSHKGLAYITVHAERGAFTFYPDHTHIRAGEITDRDIGNIAIGIAEEQLITDSAKRFHDIYEF
jgi:hypothetical protein